MNPAGRSPGRTSVPSTLLTALSLPPAAVKDSVRNLFFRTRLGRVFWAALGIRLTLARLPSSLLPEPALTVATLAAGLTLAGCGAMLLLRLWGIARKRLLWPVRRKLILSYMFIGVVPVILLAAFFLFGGMLMTFHVSALLFKQGFDDLVDEARVVAETAAIEVQRSGLGQAAEVLQRKAANATSRYPGISIALVPRRAAAKPLAAPRHVSGRWGHTDAPADVPPWVSAGGFGGLLLFSYADDPDESYVVVRAVAFPEQRDPPYGVVVDIPVDEQVQSWLRETTGITMTGVSTTAIGETAPAPAVRSRESAPVVSNVPGDGSQRWVLRSMTFAEAQDWATGRSSTVSMGIRFTIREIYNRVLAAQSRLGRYSLGELFVFVLGVIAVLFLIIEIAALVMGGALARSITGSIHQLFVGTQRVRQGDFTHRIDVPARDQLGELAESFNQMTASIEVLLHQAEEKRRLEGELRIAREIQMSLLPRGPVALPGVDMSALCVPAREVGGDYYDFFPLDDQRTGVLIADVAGKGTSAALYMAELKGLLLSLSRIHDSPKALLVQANRALTDNLDSRSFITMTYAIVDLGRRTLTYARAGHTPLIHYRADGTGRGEVDVLVPDGIVVGLRLDGIAQRFEQGLEECTVHLRPGDAFVLFTDGITEAMNPSADLFGEERLQDLVVEHGHLPPDELRDRIIQEVEAFSAGADQHDDMTMILMRVHPDGEGAGRAAAAAGSA
jgi:sigma-B regulation protein RsbU (phosphoserine phosphatase)